MIVSYRCNSCGNVFQKNMVRIESKTVCKCGYQANRIFKNIGLDKENDNVSTAIRTMMYSSNPSGKDKTIV